MEKQYQEARRLISECKPCPLKYEVWCSIAVFYEILALTKRNAEEIRQAKDEAMKYAKDAQDMQERECIQLVKGRLNGQNNVMAIAGGRRSSTAQDLFPDLLIELCVSRLFWGLGAGWGGLLAKR